MFSLNYENYRYMGGALPESDFDRVRRRAECVIRNATHNRLDKMKNIPIEVYYLGVALIEHFNNLQNTVTSKSQSSGGVSESESYAVKNIEEQSAETEQLIYDFLSSVRDDDGISLLYRGAL